MESLPSELIVEIFNYLNFDDLRCLTETCKEFNEIIGNTASLIHKFQLAIERKNNKIELNGSRRYQKLKIWCNNEKVHKNVQIVGENVTQINFRNLRITLNDFKKILNYCPNLKHLKFYNITFKPYREVHIEPLPKLKLETLIFYDCDEKILILFKECHIRTLNLQRLRGSQRYDVGFKKFKPFLAQKTELESLEFGALFQNFELFRDESLIDVGFKIKTLQLGFDSDFRSVDVRNFQKFLENQKHLRKLQVVQIFDCVFLRDVWNVLRQIVWIKELVLNDYIFPTHPMPQVEALTLLERNLFDFRDYLPNLKNLTLCKINFKHNNRPFEYNEDEIIIEHLTIIQCDQINWLFELLKSERMRLKSLTLKDTRMKRSQLKFLESLNRHDADEHFRINEMSICVPMKRDQKSGDLVKDFIDESTVYLDEDVAAEKAKLLRGKKIRMKNIKRNINLMKLRYPRCAKYFKK